MKREKSEKSENSGNPVEEKVERKIESPAAGDKPAAGPSGAEGGEKPEKRKRGRPRGSGPKIKGGSSKARQQAAAILEVMAGQLTPAEAAEALDVSVSRYYVLESRGIGGLVEACEPVEHRGRQKSQEKLVAEIQEESRQLKKELCRQQTLVRTLQRAAGMRGVLEAKTQAAKRKTRKGKLRKRTVRALKAAQALRPEGVRPAKGGADGQGPQAEGAEVGAETGRVG